MSSNAKSFDIDQAFILLDKICDENRHRDKEIMQGIDGEKEHARSVLRWVKKLEKNPSEELQLAALFHDIDRVVTPGVGGGFKGDRKSKAYENHKKAHAKRSADYITPLLLENRVNSNSADRIKFLIYHHDDTGKKVDSFKDNDLNILVAADSLAFFTSIAPKLYIVEGEKRLRDKVRFMVEKMPKFAISVLSSEKLANPVFEKVKNDIISNFA